MMALTKGKVEKGQLELGDILGFLTANMCSRDCDWT